MFSPAGKHLFTPEPAPWAPREWRAVEVDTSQPARFSREKTDKLECFGQKEVRKKRHRKKKNITFCEFCEFQFNQPKRPVFFFELGFKFLESEMVPVPPECAPEVVIVYSLGKISRFYQSSLWGFPKIMVPQNGWWKSWKTLLKWMIWGYHYFLETPLSILSCLSDLRRVTGGFICGNVSLHMLVGDWAYWQ